MTEENLTAIRHYDACNDDAQWSEHHYREARKYNVDETFHTYPRAFNARLFNIIIGLHTSLDFNLVTS